MMRLINILALSTVACSVANSNAKHVIQRFDMDPEIIIGSTKYDEAPIIDKFQHFKLEGHLDEELALLFISSTKMAYLGSKVYVIDINSEGGEVPAGHKIARTIMLLDKPTYCIVDGEGDSMALYILQDCNVRIMTRRSRLLLHGPSQLVDGTFVGDKNAYQKIADDLRTMESELVEQYCSKLKPSKKEILKMIDGRDVWMNYQQALKIGAVDTVVDNYKDAIELVKSEWKPIHKKAHRLKRHTRA